MTELRVGIIGYRNHASRIRDLAAAYPTVEVIHVYHPDGDRLARCDFASEPCPIVPTSDFGELSSCDAVLVCSPSGTHKDYQQKLLEGEARIFCEKPIGATKDELTWLASLAKPQKRRIYCNHNYAHTDFCLAAESLIESGVAGAPLHLDVAATHGLSFKKSSAGNWRFAERDAFASVVGNVGIHYFHMAHRLFGNMKDAVCHKTRCNPAVEDADGCSVMMQSQGGQTASIYLSYSAPYSNSARLWLSDGMLDMNDGCLRQYGGRDSYDADGRFATPPHEVISEHVSSKSYYDASLKRSLDLFFDVVEAGGDFSDRHFDEAVSSARMTLSLYEGAGVVDISANK